MKAVLIILLTVMSLLTIYGQDSRTMAGDWVRVKAEYQDGSGRPEEIGSRVLVRYHFTNKELHQIFAESTHPGGYTRSGNVLRVEPVQVFRIENYTNTALTLVESGGSHPIRYFFIPLDSFQRSGQIRYRFEVTDNDTIYFIAPGIEPIYPKGQEDFMRSIMTGFTQKAGFNFTYVVQKDGTIGDVTIKASTNPKLNKRLIQLLKKTSGMWLPATYKGRAINVRLNGSISFSG